MVVESNGPAPDKAPAYPRLGSVEGGSPFHFPRLRMTRKPSREARRPYNVDSITVSEFVLELEELYHLRGIGCTALPVSGVDEM